MDKNVESVISKHRKRADAGLRKYNVTTERKDLSTVDWLIHLQEELMDAAVYVEAALAHIATQTHSQLKVENRQLREAAQRVLAECYTDDDILNRHSHTTVGCKALRELQAVLAKL